MDNGMQVPGVCLNCRWCWNPRPNAGEEYNAAMPIVATCIHDPRHERIEEAQSHLCSYFEQTDQVRYTVPIPVEEQMEGEEDDGREDD